MKIGGQAIPTVEEMDELAIKLIAMYATLGYPCALARKFDGVVDVRVLSSVRGLAETSAFLDHAADVVFGVPAGNA